MSHRLSKTLQDAKKKNKKLFCAFITLGYPSLKDTEKLLFEFEKLGVDIIELGIPFSDPMADGPTIQYSSEQALSRGVSLEDGFRLLAQARKRGLKTPVICFSYLNPIFSYGVKTFPLKATQSGFDGVIIPDLPPEEEVPFQKECARRHLAQIFLVTPTTRFKRAQMIGKKSKAFVYYVSMRGVTGARKNMDPRISREIRTISKAISQPLLVGFGISSPQQSKAMAKISEGVIVGSAIIQNIRAHHGKIADVSPFIRQMIRSIQSAR